MYLGHFPELIHYILVIMDIYFQEYQRLNEMKNLYQAELELRDRKRRQTVGNPLGTARS